MEDKIPNVVYSEYFKQDFSVLTFPSTENPNIQVISHDSLERIIFNDIPLMYPDIGLNFDVCVDYPKIGNAAPDPNHFVYRCTIWDKQRKVMKVGETKTETLDTEIAKNHPALIAEMRAFDRAAIAYLALPGKSFSTSEGVPYNGFEVQSLDEPVVESSNSAPVDKTTEAKEVKIEDFSVGCGNVLVNIGEYRDNPITVEELYKVNPTYVNWIAKAYFTDNDMKKACNTYLKKIEEDIAYGSDS